MQVHENIINLLVEKSRKNPLSIHLDLIGLIRLGKSQAEMIEKFSNILNETSRRGGNIVVPSYTYSFTKHETFDLSTSSTPIGKVYEGLLTFNPKRTHDGNFSYICFSETLFSEHLSKKLSYETFGKDSLIDDLFVNDGYLCALGCGLDQLTEIHYLEKKLKVSYRFDKEFKGKVLSNNNEYIQNNKFFCRDDSLGLKSNFKMLYNDLKESGLIQYWKIENLFEIEAIKFSTLYEYLKQKLEVDAYYLCEEDDMMKLLKEVYPLHRTLVSEGTDRAFDITKKFLPSSIPSSILEYKCGSDAWYWKVPYRYKVNKAVLKDENGNEYANFHKNYLHLWSYSIAVKDRFTFEELEKHLYYSKKRPDAIPWNFKYYEKTWGFCLSYNEFKKMPISKKYEVDIDVEFLEKPGFKVMTSYIDNRCDKDFLVASNICHPNQVNDSITGLVVAVEIAKRITNRPIVNPMKNIRFLFCPETIGSIVYLSNNEELIEKISSASFLEMLGHRDDDEFILQLSRNKDDLINKIYRYVLNRKKIKYSVRPFARWNDEGIINGPGVNIPCPFLMRGEYLKDENEPYDNSATRYYDEYHTSDDNPFVMSYEKLSESADILEEVVRIYCSNYTPIQLKKGIIFLSALGLHVSFWDNPELCGKIEKILMNLEGQKSLFEISDELNMDYWECKKFIDELYKKGAIEVLND